MPPLLSAQRRQNHFVPFPEQAPAHLEYFPPFCCEPDNPAAAVRLVLLLSDHAPVGKLGKLPVQIAGVQSEGAADIFGRTAVPVSRVQQDVELPQGDAGFCQTPGTVGGKLLSQDGDAGGKGNIFPQTITSI